MQVGANLPPKATPSPSFSVLSDAPQSGADLLEFGRYLKPLLAMLNDPATETPFTVGIFGTWGSGKSTLLDMLRERLTEEHESKFLWVDFNPWLHRGEPSMLVLLLHTLQDTLEADEQKRFTGSVKKIGTVLLRLGADVLLKKLTADVVSLEDIETLGERYVNERGRIQSEVRSLRKALQDEVDAIYQGGAQGGAQIILAIDDLDRCDPLEIIDVLESIKLFLNLEHVFVFLAVDKEVIDRGIEVRYHRFEFSESRRRLIGAEYLEKMVQLPVHLYPLAADQVGSFMRKCKPTNAVEAQIPMLQQIVLPNPRRIKRVLNIIGLTYAIRDQSPRLKHLDPALFARLAVLQVQEPELYADVLEVPELLAALEEVYGETRDPEKEEDFVDFGALAEWVHNRSAAFYRPSTPLARLFKNAGFAEVKDDLGSYLTML